jgi:hypothetical protein
LVTLQQSSESFSWLRFILVSAGPDGQQNTSDDIHYMETGNELSGLGVGAFDSTVWSEAAPEPSDQP